MHGGWVLGLLVYGRKLVQLDMTFLNPDVPSCALLALLALLASVPALLPPWSLTLSRLYKIMSFLCL
jgi:hypothetical protein